MSRKIKHRHGGKYKCKTKNGKTVMKKKPVHWNKIPTKRNYGASPEKEPLFIVTTAEAERPWLVERKSLRKLHNRFKDLNVTRLDDIGQTELKSFGSAISKEEQKKWTDEDIFGKQIRMHTERSERSPTFHATSGEGFTRATDASAIIARRERERRK